MLGFSLGNGWYRGRLGWTGAPRLLRRPARLARPAGDRRSPTATARPSSPTTAGRPGPSDVLANDLYDGQTIDARLRDDAWKRPGFAADGWVGVEPAFDLPRLTPYVGPPVAGRRAAARSRSGLAVRTHAGRLRAEPGRLAAVPRARRGRREITLRHAEVLEDGELGVRPLRAAQATDRLVLSGGDDVFEPTLTFHGFRYAEVTGWPGELHADSLEAVVVHSDLRRIGHFECSDHAAQPAAQQRRVGPARQLPRRADRLPAARRATRLDRRHRGLRARRRPSSSTSHDFLRDWLLDLAAEQQRPDGLVPFVVPDVLKYDGAPDGFPAPETAAIWGDAAVWVPWALWQAYGDRAVLDDQYDSMAAHVHRVESLLSPTGLWDTGFQFGDWLDPHAPPDEPCEAKADNGVVATACLYRTAAIVADSAELLGHEEEAAGSPRWRPTAPAFNDHYVDRRHDHQRRPDRLRAGHRLRPARRERPRRAGDRLAELVAEDGYHIPTGFAGTPYVTDALTDDRPPRRRVPAAAGAECPPGSTRSRWARPRSGNAGTRCCPTADQPRRDDELQPLRARRGRRLDAPDDRRHRPARARLPPRTDRPPPGRWAHLGVHEPGDAARARHRRGGASTRGS